MPRIMPLCVCAPLLALVAAPACAVYKCETEGRVAYSDRPCPNGKLIATDSAPVDRESAERQNIREKSELKRLEHERHKREAQEEKERQRIAQANAAKQKRCAKLALRNRHAQEDAAAAVGKGREGAALKARRIDDQYQLECGG